MILGELVWMRALTSAHRTFGGNSGSGARGSRQEILWINDFGIGKSEDLVDAFAIP
jgi:hypothetical protein